MRLLVEGVTLVAGVLAICTYLGINIKRWKMQQRTPPPRKQLPPASGDDQEEE